MKTLITIILFVLFVLFYDSLNCNNVTTELNYKTDNRDSLIKEYEIMKTTLESNIRLYQHYVAVKYSNKEHTKENIKAFLKEAKILKPNQAFDVGLHETGNGNAGVGKEPNNNHVGMKIPRNRFSWSLCRASGHARFESWPFGYLDLDEYTRAGFKIWRSDVPNN